MAKFNHMGSISHGTLRTQDLLEVFASKLEELDATSRLINKARDIAYRIEHACQCCDELEIRDEADELVDVLMTVLDGFSPPFVYFGVLEGDGSDFGFWLDNDTLCEALYGLPEMVDGRYPVTDSGMVVEINDHGNVTVYGTDGEEIFSVHP